MLPWLRGIDFLFGIWGSGLDGNQKDEARVMRLERENERLRKLLKGKDAVIRELKRGIRDGWKCS